MSGSDAMIQYLQASYNADIAFLSTAPGAPVASPLGLAVEGFGIAGITLKAQSELEQIAQIQESQQALAAGDTVGGALAAQLDDWAAQAQGQAIAMNASNAAYVTQVGLNSTTPGLPTDAQATAQAKYISDDLAPEGSPLGQILAFANNSQSIGGIFLNLVTDPADIPLILANGVMAGLYLGVSSVGEAIETVYDTLSSVVSWGASEVSTLLSGLADFLGLPTSAITFTGDGPVTLTPGSDGAVILSQASDGGTTSLIIGANDPSVAAIVVSPSEIAGESTAQVYATDGSSTTFSYSGTNGTGQLLAENVENADGTSELLTFNADSTGYTAINYSGPNGTGAVIGEDVENPDGTSTITTYLGGVGLAVSYTGPDGTGSISGVSLSVLPSGPEPTFDNFISAVSNALADDLARIYLGNSLLASASAQALASALNIAAFNNNTSLIAIGGVPLTGEQAFAANFAISLGGILGGAAGSALGSDLFKELGLPPQLGSTLGGVAGNAAGQQLAADVAQEFSNATVALQPVATLANAAGAIGSLLGSDLSDLISNNIGIGSSIGGDIGAAIGEVAGSEFGPPGAFIGSTIGSFIGSLIGSLFGPGPSVGPNALAVVVSSGGKFSLGKYSADNGGDVNIAVDMANAAIQTANEILAAEGGTLGATTAWSFGYFKGAARALPTSNYPNYGPAYSDSTTAVEAGVLQMVESAQFIGGDPYVEWAISHSDDSTLDDLLSDIQVAQAYESYIKNPLAFDVSLAASDNATLFQDWENDLARAQVLGLDQINAQTTTNTYDSNGNLVS